MYHQIMTTIISIHIHDVIDDVTRSRNRSNIEIDISPSIFELQRRSKAKNVGKLMAIFLVYSPSGITSGKKSLSRVQNGGRFEHFEISNTASI